MKLSTKLWTTYIMGGVTILIVVTLVEFAVSAWVMFTVFAVTIIISTALFVWIERK